MVASAVIQASPAIKLAARAVTGSRAAAKRIEGQSGAEGAGGRKAIGASRCFKAGKAKAADTAPTPMAARRNP